MNICDRYFIQVDGNEPEEYDDLYTLLDDWYKCYFAPSCVAWVEIWEGNRSCLRYYLDRKIEATAQ